MTRYYCHNCKDVYLKTPTAVVDHVWVGHGVFVEEVSQLIMRSMDARLPPEKTRKKRVDFRCDDCDMIFEGIFSFLKHLDKAHDIHIWYEKGLTRRRLYLDGILDMETDDKTKQQELLGQPKKNVPLSKKPYEPRKNEENE